MGETFASHIYDKVFVPRIYKELFQLRKATQFSKQAKDLNKLFPKECIQKSSSANKHMKKHSILVIKEMQIQTTVRFHFNHTRVTIIKKTDKNKCLWGNWKPHTLTGGTLINDVAGLKNNLAIL